MNNKTEKKREDCLKKAITKDGDATVTVVDATNLVNESMERVGSWPPATLHLGRGLMGAILLLSATDKADTEKLAIQWNCEGPFGDLYVESSAMGRARGTILNPQANVKDLDTNLGTGTMQVRRISKTVFTGVVPASGNVSLDLVEYLEKSEQRKCGINFTVQIQWQENKKLPFYVEGAYGYLIDILPNSDHEKRMEIIRKWDSVMVSLGSISDWKIDQKNPTDSMLQLLTMEKKPNEIMYQKVSFFCPCSKERAERALVLASQSEGQKKQNDEEEVRCEFCGKIYLIQK